MNTGLIECIRLAEGKAAEMVEQAKAEAGSRLQALLKIQAANLVNLESMYAEKRDTVPDLARKRAADLLAEKRGEHESILATIRKNGERHRDEAVNVLMKRLLE